MTRHGTDAQIASIVPLTARRTMGDFAIIAIERAVEEFEATIAAKKAEKLTR